MWVRICFVSSFQLGLQRQRLNYSKYEIILKYQISSLLPQPHWTPVCCHRLSLAQVCNLHAKVNTERLKSSFERIENKTCSVCRRLKKKRTRSQSMRGVWWEEWCGMNEWTVCRPGCQRSLGGSGTLLLSFSSFFYILWLTVIDTVILNNTQACFV